MAHDGDEAIEKATEEQPDMVLLDIMLPGKDGLEVCREIRKSSEMPIIMLTAKDSEIDKVLGLELGADDYVTKPFSTRNTCSREGEFTSPSARWCGREKKKIRKWLLDQLLSIQMRIV